MIRWTFVSYLGEATLSLDTTDATRGVDLAWTGRDAAVDDVARWLSMLCDSTGHRIGKHASPRSVDQALRGTKRRPYEIRVVEGKAHLRAPAPDRPPPSG